MNLAGWANGPVPVIGHPPVQGHVGPTEEEILSRVNRTGHQSAWQRSDTDLLVAWQSSRQGYGNFHIYRHAFIMQLVSGMQQKQVWLGTLYALPARGCRERFIQTSSLTND